MAARHLYDLVAKDIDKPPIKQASTIPGTLPRKGLRSAQRFARSRRGKTTCGPSAPAWPINCLS
jgi:hypothetical protein